MISTFFALVCALDVYFAMGTEGTDRRAFVAGAIFAGIMAIVVAIEDRR